MSINIAIPGARTYSHEFNKNIAKRVEKRIEKAKNNETQNGKGSKEKGSQGGEAACCSITSLDEPANAANQSSSFGNDSNHSVEQITESAAIATTDHDTPHSTSNMHESGSDGTNEAGHLDSNNEAEHGTSQGHAHDSGHDVMHNPFDSTTLEVALTPFVSVLGAAGVYIGYKIYKDFNNKKISLEDALYKINKVLEDEEYEGKKLNLTTEQKQTYQAYSTVIQEQYNEADFQQFWAGKLSSLSSGAIVLGQFVMPIGIAALFSLGTIGAAHTAHMARNISQSNAKINRANSTLQEVETENSNITENKPKTEEERTNLEIKEKDAHIRKHYFKGKRKHEAINMLGWAAFSGGAYSLGFLQAIALASGTGVAATPAIAGVSALGAGVAGTVVENNILTSSRFVTAMPVHAWKSMSQIASNENQENWYGQDGQSHKGDTLSHEEVQKKNITASQKLEIAKQYRKDFFGSRTTGQRLTHALLRTRQKTLAYSTLGLVPHFTSKMKFNDKVRVSKQNSQEANERRIEALTNLKKVEDNLLSELVRNIEEQEELKNTSTKLITQKPKYNKLKDKNKKTNYDLGKLIDSIIKNGQEDGVAKMIAQKIMENKTIELKADEQEKVKSWRTKLNLRRSGYNQLKDKSLIAEEQEEVKTWKSRLRFRKSGYNQFQDKVAKKDILVITKKYDDLFDINTDGIEFENVFADSPKDRLDALKTIKDTPPCCSSAYHSQGIFEYIKEVFTSDDVSSSFKEKQQRMASLVQEATDQFLLYQSKKSAHEHIAIWSNLSDAYQKAEKNSDKESYVNNYKIMKNNDSDSYIKLR